VTKAQRSIAALAVVVALMGVIVVSVRGSYGAFHKGYRLSGTFTRASYGVEPGTQVEYRGIPVGKVDSVHLVDHQAELRMSINQGFRVPVNVNAVIRPRSIFGDPYVDLDFAPGSSGPFLKAGDRLPKTGVDAETGDLIASAVPLLEKINAHDLATVIDELAKASDNEGLRIRSSIENATQLGDFFATTIQEQLTALDSFAAFQAQFAPTGPSFNAIAANSNIALPTLNAAEVDFQRALDSLTPFANKLAAFLSAEHPDFDRLLDQGDNVVRLLTLREPQLEQVVSGLSRYVYKFAVGQGPETLPNGTKFAFFKNFVMFSDVNALICGILSQGGPTTAPLLQAISQSGGPINCPPASPAASVATGQAATRELTDGVDGVAAAPQPPERLTVQALVDRILGRG
jgi:virulence factor Mce-like protein